MVVGNPPYVRIQTLPREEADYYRSHYEAAYGSFDIYVLFLERGINLVKPGGRLGFICSSKFLKSQYGSRILKLMTRECVVEDIVDLSAQTVFAEATTYPAIVVLRKGGGDGPLRYISVPQRVTDSAVTSVAEVEGLPPVVTDQGAVTGGMWPPLAAGDTLWQKLTANTEPLGNLADRIFQGLITSADRVYILQKRGEVEGGLVRVYSRATGRQHILEAALLKPFLTGKNIDRYFSAMPRELLLFPYEISQGKATLLSEKGFGRKYPKTWEYLNLNREILEQREGGKFRGEGWYRFGRTQNLAIHDQPKLAIPSTVKRLTACYDPEGAMHLDNVRVNGILIRQGNDASYKYVLGLLNSRLLHWFFARVATPFANSWFGANRQFIEPLPIRRIDFSNPAEKKMHDELVSQVERMLALHRKLRELEGFEAEERHEVEREIERTDQAIDTLVYDLYGLTGEERKIVGSGP